MRTTMILLLILFTFPAQPETVGATAPDVWTPFRFFVGSWKGTSHGQPGQGRVERSYDFVLAGKFLQIANKSTYPPQPSNLKGEVHKDIGFISFDGIRQRFVLRQFHIEGFVNTYVAESLASEARTIRFTSEAIENIPSGYRARETYEILGKDEFVERFEIADPGKEFALYSESRLHRKRVQ